MSHLCIKAAFSRYDCVGHFLVKSLGRMPYVHNLSRSPVMSKAAFLLDSTLEAESNEKSLTYALRPRSQDMTVSDIPLLSPIGECPMLIT